MIKQKGLFLIAALIMVFTILFEFPTADVQAASVKLNKTKLVLNVGDTYQLKVTNAKGTIKWSSANTKIAKVSAKGKVTAVGEGSCTVKANTSGKLYSCKVTVNQLSRNELFGKDISKETGTITKRYTYSGDGLEVTYSADLNGYFCRDSGEFRGIYISAGSKAELGFFKYSADGVDWKDAQAPLCSKMKAIACSTTMAVAVGEHGQILYSRDGMSWSKAASGITQNINDVLYDGEDFIAVGGNSDKTEDGSMDSTAIILSSSDGIHWNLKASFKELPINTIAWNGTRYIAGGVAYSYVELNSTGNTSGQGMDVFTSEDGDSWSCHSVNDPFVIGGFRTLGYFKGTFFASTDYYQLISSTDGLTWKLVMEDCGVVNEFKEHDGALYAAATGGIIYKTKDGTNWKTIDTGDDYYISTLLFCKDSVVGLGKGVLLKSKDEVTWDVTVLHYIYDFFTVNFCEGITILIGDEMSGVNIHGTSHMGGNGYYSLDGVEWKQFHLSMAAGSISGILSNGATYIKYGDFSTGGYSRDGNEWTDFEIGNTGNFIWDGSRYIGIGENGYLLVSKDGIDWDKSYAGFGDMFALCYGRNGLYVLVGRDGNIYTSGDLNTWTKEISPVTDNLENIACGDNGYVAISSTGDVITSKDGHHWELTYSLRYYTSWYGTLCDVAYGNGHYVIVGQYGTIPLTAVCQVFPSTLCDRRTVWNHPGIGGCYSVAQIRYWCGYPDCLSGLDRR